MYKFLSWLLFSFRTCVDGTNFSNLLLPALDPLRNNDPLNNVFSPDILCYVILFTYCICLELLPNVHRPYYDIGFLLKVDSY